MMVGAVVEDGIDRTSARIAEVAEKVTEQFVLERSPVIFVDQNAWRFRDYRMHKVLRNYFETFPAVDRCCPLVAEDSQFVWLRTGALDRAAHNDKEGRGKQTGSEAR
jgi:hypothetical protein